MDDENALEWYYFGARPYNPEIGRFLNPDRYAQQLGSAVRIYLREDGGVTFEEIMDVINSIERPEIPFFDTIFSELRSNLRISEERLRSVMYILERCGMLQTRTKKTYFSG